MTSTSSQSSRRGQAPATPPPPSPRSKKPPRARRERLVRPPRPWFRHPLVVTIAGLAVAIAALFGIYVAGKGSGGTDGGSGSPAYAVGSPGPGQSAPDFSLASASGGTVNLSDYRGKNVLLYFQEGISCQPCWTQITDLEKAGNAVQTAGVDAVVSITTDPASVLTQKVTDEGISRTPVLSDPDLTVSQQYGTAGAGMMGAERNGHSFVLVGPDGTIKWRADYGGAPDYTMYVPVDQLLADLQAGVSGK